MEIEVSKIDSGLRTEFIKAYYGFTCFEERDNNVVCEMFERSIDSLHLQQVRLILDKITKICSSLTDELVHFKYSRMGLNNTYIFLFQLSKKAKDKLKSLSRVEAIIESNKSLSETYRVLTEQVHSLSGKVIWFETESGVVEMQVSLRCFEQIEEITRSLSNRPSSKLSTNSAKFYEINRAISGLKSESAKVFVKRYLYLAEDCLKNGELGIEAIAAKMFYSESQLRRILKSITGFLPNDFTKYIKISMVHQMMKDDIPLKQIALDCGFANQSHMCDIFKKFMDMTPLEFKKYSING